ncbi:MAG: hypothetical protein JW719_14460 [Pirellulales bacterium]|nr:hypothetical protein [Pirellulales bacterium]
MRIHRRSLGPIVLSGFLVLAVLPLGCDQPSSQSRLASSDDVYSLIQISMQPGSLLDSAGKQADLQEFEIFKATQAQLLKSNVVLLAALRKPDIASLSIYKKHQEDPVAWLQNRLVVSFPGDAEIMRVSLDESNNDEAVKMLRAVVEAYLGEVVETQRNQKARELTNLAEVLAGKEREIRAKRTALKQLAEELGTADPETLRMQLQLASSQLAMYQQELLRAQSESRKTTADRKVLEAALRRLEKNNPADGAADRPSAQPELQRVSEELSVVVGQLAQVVAQLSDAQVSEMLQNELAVIRQQIAAWQGLLGVRLIELRRAELRERLQEADVRAALAAEEIAELEKEVDARKKEFQSLGRSSVDVEMMRADLDNLQKAANDVASRLQILEVETKSPSRIRLIQRAERSPKKQSPEKI